MLRTLLVAFILLAVQNARAQNQRLEPARDFGSYEGMLGQYYTGLFGLLLPGLSDTPVARYMVLPSFSPESVLSVEKDKSGVYRMILRICSQNYWYARHKEEVDVYIYQRNIDVALAQAIDTLFSTLMIQMQKPERPVMGFDGVSYYFTATTAEGPTTGKVWSPRKNTPMARLVIVCDQLTQYTQQKGPAREALLQEIVKLNQVLNL